MGYRHDDRYVILSIIRQSLKSVKHVMAVDRPGCLSVLGQVADAPDIVEFQVLYMGYKNSKVRMKLMFLWTACTFSEYLTVVMRY